MASIARSTAQRFLLLKMYPRPASLGESREILRLISQFGEVEFFKNLKYDTLTAPNSAMVVFKDEAAAEECLRRSPIRFRMGKAPAGDQLSESQTVHDLPVRHQDNYVAARRLASQEPQASLEPQTPSPDSYQPFGFRQTRSMSTSALPDPPPGPPQMPLQPRPPPQLQSRIFQIVAHRGLAKLRDHIDSGQFHGGFEIDYKSIASQDLIPRVPSLGLSAVNWRAPARPWRVVRNEREQENSGPERRKSLRELYNEGKSSEPTSSEPEAPDGIQSHDHT